MSVQDDITYTDQFFVGERKRLVFEVFANVEQTVMRDASGWFLEWTLSSVPVGAVPFEQPGTLYVIKTSPGAITVSGTFNASPGLNQQRVYVQLESEDTAFMNGGRYVHSLRRTDQGGQISHGIVRLQNVRGTA